MKPAALISSVVALAALAASAYGLLEVLEVGTCASGGPYEVARECPEGTGGKVLLLAGGLVVYIFAIIAASFSDFGAGMFWFGLLFVVLGGAMLYAELSDKVTGGGGVGYILAGVFIPMGIFPLLGGLKSMFDRDDGPPAYTAAQGLSAQVQASADAAGRMRPAFPVPPAAGATPAPFAVPGATPAPPQQAPSAADAVAELTKLAELRDRGVLTEDEFQAQKARLLNPHG